MNHFIRQIAGPKLQAVVRHDCEQLARKHTFGGIEYVKSKDLHKLAEYPLTPDECIKACSPFHENQQMQMLQDVVSAMDSRLWDHLGISAERLGRVQCDPSAGLLAYASNPSFQVPERKAIDERPAQLPE